MRRLCDTVRHVAICGGRELRESRGVGRLTHNQLPPLPPRLASPPSHRHAQFQPQTSISARTFDADELTTARPSDGAQIAPRGAAPREPAVHAWRAHVAWRSPLEEPHLLQAAVCAPHSEERRRPEEQHLGRSGEEHLGGQVRSSTWVGQGHLGRSGPGHACSWRRMEA